MVDNSTSKSERVPRGVLKKDKEPPETHSCGICGASYPDAGSLYQHQMATHDPDGIMFSEIGLPK